MRFNLQEKAKNTNPVDDNSYQLQVKELTEKSAQLSELLKSCQKICDNLGVPFILVVPGSISVTYESIQEKKEDEYYESSWQASSS